MNLTRDPVSLVPYLTGVFSAVYRRKQKKGPSLSFYGSTWTFTVILTYFVVLETLYSTFYFLVPLLFFSVFTFPYFTEKRKLLGDLLFSVFLIGFGAYLFALPYETQNIFLDGLIALTAIPLPLVLLFGICGLIIFFFWNEVTALRRESHSLANFLTLILAISLTLFLIFDFLSSKCLPQRINASFFCVPLILIYLLIVSYGFLTVSLSYQLNQPRYNQDFIVVLGAGLINRETVSPLLTKRVNKVIAFYRAQSRVTLNSPILLMFGGQGANEEVPEATAMEQYAMEQETPGRDIFTEADSTTALENMLYSEEIMDQQVKGPYHTIFSSNNYHTLRASLYAQRAKLETNGTGAKITFYYLSNAFLREYITILMTNKKRHMIICRLLFTGSAFLSPVTLLF